MAIEVPRLLKRCSRTISARLNDEKLYNHGSSTIKHYGRGAVLTVDLINRCNMMCDPVFMDANRRLCVHELSLKRPILIKLFDQPRRQTCPSVQFSGGEPTISPHFYRYTKYCAKFSAMGKRANARSDQRHRVRQEQRALAAEAGLRYAYSSMARQRRQHTARSATCSQNCVRLTTA